MSKFNRPTVKPAVHSPITTEAVASGRTHEGAPGFARDAESELFLLAVSNMVGEHTFYEKADARDDRFEQLVRQVAVEDPDWFGRFVPWLRSEANMRTASLVAAVEGVKARLDAAKGNAGGIGAQMTVGYQTDDHAAGGQNRKLIAAACQRPDEPAELLAYWTSRYGRAIPKPVKRGIADAAARLYSERSLLKWDTPSRGYRFGDVIDLTHPTPADDKPWQGDLFKHALDRRHNRDNPIPERLRTLHRHAEIMQVPVAERRAYLRAMTGTGTDAPGNVLASAGITWEALAGWLQGPMDAEAWEAAIPSMGVMALCRNLRNFDQAGVSDRVAEQAAARISDPEQVARSRMFPFRFWAAYKAAPSLRWGHALEKALSASLANVPALTGRTLILVDRSPSMFPGYGFSTPNASDITLAEQAAVFGAALALRAENPTLVEFGGKSRVMPVPKGGSVLRLIGEFTQIDGTDIPSAIKAHFAGHDRIVVVTDEQTRAGYLPSNMWQHGGMRETAVDELVPASVPLYMWNFAGYRLGAVSGSRNRHTFGGLTDQAFRMIPLLESGRDAGWPF
jgi:hypothetical protein